MLTRVLAAEQRSGVFRRKSLNTHIDKDAWEATRYLAIEASQGDAARYYHSADVVAAREFVPRTISVYTWYLARLEIVGLLGHVPESSHDLDRVEEAIGTYIQSLVGVHPRYVRLAVQMMFYMPQDEPDLEPPIFTSLVGVILGALIRGKAESTIDESKSDLEAYLIAHGTEMRHRQAD